MNLKKNLSLALFTNLLCLFPAAHVIFPLLFFEPILIMSAVKGDNSAQVYWAICALLQITGQLIIVTGLFQNNNLLQKRYGVIGLLILLSALINIYFLLPEQDLLITFISAIPFLIFCGLFLVFKTEKKKLIKETTYQAVD